MVRVEDISKKYGAVEALSGVSFEVSRGEIFGLIGADGAGKTTLFRILTTLLLPDSGYATVDGFDIKNDYRAIRRSVGYMPGRFSLYGDLTVEENLHFFASIFGTTIAKNYDLVSDIYRQIEPFKTRRAAKLSGGMKQKLALCCALIHRPTVLFLDEPTTGVDPVSRGEFWQMLSRLKNEGITIIVSTPYMDEAVLCERIGFIGGGRLTSVATPADIVADYRMPIWAVAATEMQRLLKELRTIDGVMSCFAFGSHHHLTLSSDKLTISELRATLERSGYKQITIEPITPTIEDCFIMEQSLRAGQGTRAE